MEGIIGKKLGQSRIFNENGDSIPVTVIEAGPCFITQIKTEEIDGYSSIQLGFGEAKEKRLNKAKLGHLKKAGKSLKVLKEFNLLEDEKYKVGDEIRVDTFEIGKRVKVTGISKGKGFQGVMRRHGFHGGQATHGQKDRLRAPGSIGASSDPSRVWKGMKMGGHTGDEQITMMNLEVVKINKEENLLFVKGSIPGAKNSIVKVIKAKV
ncbi:MAG: 50S ribosomal protein L3 [Candidatus Marinimicrobia bacterium]|nr:50S ribosomal protein L3 [Candidatus Neomarinimicrobiota bacterium]